jgi:hypothetical protein
MDAQNALHDFKKTKEPIVGAGRVLLAIESVDGRQFGGQVLCSWIEGHLPLWSDYVNCNGLIPIVVDFHQAR